MPGPITSADLLAQVRAQIDEANTETVTDSDLYAALNRAQRKAANILVKHYEDMFLTFTTQQSTGGQDTYDIPANAFGRRISSVLITFNNLEYPLKRAAFSDLHKFTSLAQVRIPSVYAMKGRSYVIKPMPNQGITFKLWYPAAPETVVKPLGRITSFNSTTNYVVLDAVDGTLTTDAPSLAAFVNLVDAQTGVIKATMQVASISGTQVMFKSAGLSLPSVYGRTVVTAIPDVAVTPTLTSHQAVNVNDYVCAVQGTCVPDLPEACLDYMVAYSVREIRRRLGEAVGDENQFTKDLEADVQSQWSNREIRSRIMNRNRAWTR